MATRTREVKVLDNRIDILNRDATEPSPAQKVFRTTSAVIVLVQDKRVRKNYAHLSDFFFGVYEDLKTAFRGNNAGDLNESIRVALENLERLTREIERTLMRGADAPNTKEKVERHRLEIQQVLSSLTIPRSPLESLSVDGRASNPVSIDPHDTSITSVSDSACGRLLRRAFDPPELPSLIEEIFSSKDGGNTIRCLHGDDAQTFVDVIDEALESLDLSQRIRKRCLRALYRTCGRNVILPRSLQIPLCYNRQDFPLCAGSFGDVWKGKHNGLDVAVKVIRTHLSQDSRTIVGKFCKEVVTWKALRHPNVLPLIGVTMDGIHFAMVSEWMENGTINQFVEKNPDADRLGLLADVATGLIYIHDQEMVHGDLKGVNILIDRTGHARLTDFGLLTIVSDPSIQLSYSSNAQGGTARWMSPELISPKRFGFEKSRPTKSSDCYALGMVIYEIISGRVPFHEDRGLAVFTRVLDGERPPRDAEFADVLWETLEQCWSSDSDARPSVEDVLRCLEGVISFLKPAPSVDETTEEDPDDLSSANGSSVDIGIPQPIVAGPHRCESWRYIDLCNSEICSDCGQTGHATGWRRCRKNSPYPIASALFEGDFPPPPIDPVPPHQIVHFSRTRLQDWGEDI